MAQTVSVVTSRGPRTSNTIGVGIDTSELKTLARDLRKLDPAVGRNFTRGVKTVGDIVAGKAKENARSFPRAGDGTDRIEGTIKVQGGFTTLRVVAGGEEAPEAAAIENKGQAGSFRHPVFGDRENWVDQTAHPYLAPAGDDGADASEAALLEVIDASLREVGFGT